MKGKILMPRPEKVKAVESIAKLAKEAQSIFITDYTGLTVDEITNLRRKLREQSIQYVVVKNTLARLAFRDAELDYAVNYLKGPTALAFAMENPTAPAKVFVDFIKKTKKAEVRAFVMEGQVFMSDQLEDFAKLPSREDLLSMTLGTLNAPIVGLVGGLQGIIRKVVYVMDAIREKQEQG